MKRNLPAMNSNDSQSDNHSVEQRERERQRRIEINRKDSIPVLKDLAHAGIEIEWISELNRRNQEINYREAIPVLLHWLPRIDNVDVKETIVRALTVSWAKPIAAEPLIQEFKKYGDKENSGIKWAIANALEVVGDDSVFAEIVQFVQNKEHGSARQMLALTLGKMKDPRAEEILMQLLGDEEVEGHAIMALGKLKSKNAVPEIEKYLNHPRTWIRNEAKKALKRIEKKK